MFWYFTKRGVSEEEYIAVKYSVRPDAAVRNSSLPAIAIEDPATLILRNVDERYDGKYRLGVAVASGGGNSEVDVFVAGKFFASKLIVYFYR